MVIERFRTILAKRNSRFDTQASLQVMHVVRPLTQKEELERVLGLRQWDLKRRALTQSTT